MAKRKAVAQRKYRFDLYRQSAEFVAAFDRPTDSRSVSSLRVFDLSITKLYDILLAAYKKGVRDGRKAK